MNSKWGAILVASFAAGWLGCPVGSAQLADTRSTVAKWVETRQLISREQSDWKADKEMLQQSVFLFERELETLEAEFEKISTNTLSIVDEQKENTVRKAELEASEEAAQTLVTRFEATVKTLAKSFPPPLLNTLEESLGSIPEHSNDTKRSVIERMQVIVAVLNEADKFNGTVATASEYQQNPQGDRVQVQTLYLGLGQAYFVDSAGGYAGVGVPGPGGWKWTERNELAPLIQRAIGIYASRLPAAFVELPVTIQ